MTLNRDENDVLAALETSIYYKELLGQNSPVLPMNPEREAVVAALMHFSSLLDHLPAMLAHVGYGFTRTSSNIFEALDYISGLFYKGDRAARKVRVLDPEMLFHYVAFSRTLGKQIDGYKVWNVFICRHFQHPSVQAAILQQLISRQKDIIYVQQQQQIQLEKIFGTDFSKNYSINNKGA
uniref:WASH-7_mid domain-containing protein n=1 Tax=Caenorhabditis tropicalis TaxID=1561998 RepID=A0A1I7T2M4_9PELO